MGSTFLFYSHCIDALSDLNIPNGLVLYVHRSLSDCCKEQPFSTPLIVKYVLGINTDYYHAYGERLSLSLPFLSFPLAFVATFFLQLVLLLGLLRRNILHPSIPL